MEKICFAAVITVALAISLFAQTTNISGTSVKETLINLETRMWQALKDKDDKHLYILTTKDFVSVSELDIADKAATLRNITRLKCEIKSFKMEEFSLTMFNANTALLAYKAEKNNVCEGNGNSATVWASSLYLKQNGKWLNAFHQETPASQQK